MIASLTGEKVSPVTWFAAGALGRAASHHPLSVCTGIDPGVLSTAACDAEAPAHLSQSGGSLLHGCRSRRVWGGCAQRYRRGKHGCAHGVATDSHRPPSALHTRRITRATHSPDKSCATSTAASDSGALAALQGIEQGDIAVLLASAAYSTYTVRLSRSASRADAFDLAAGKTLAR